MAAELLTRTHGLDTGRHLGAIVDVIAELVDCDRWTGRDLALVLTEDARITPRDWPNTIANPAAFLRHRLSGLLERLTGPSPSEAAAAQHHALLAEQVERAREHRIATENTASPDTVRARMAEIRATLERRRLTRRAMGASKLTPTRRLKGEK